MPLENPFTRDLCVAIRNRERIAREDTYARESRWKKNAFRRFPVFAKGTRSERRRIVSTARSSRESSRNALT